MQTQRDSETDERSMTSLATLTPAERRVLDEALRGLSSHLAHIYAKLGVRGRIDLLAAMTPAGGETAGGGGNGPPSRRSPSRQRGWLAYGSLPTIIAGAVLVWLVAAWLAGLAGPVQITAAELNSLIATGAVSDLDLTGKTLQAATTSGESYEVTAIEVDQIRPIAAGNDIPFSHRSAGPGGLTAAQVLLNVLPYLAIVTIVWVVAVAAVRGQLAGQSAA